MANVLTQPKTAPATSTGNRLNLSFGGAAVREIREAAAELGISPQKFVARAVQQAIKILRYQARGYSAVMRDARGVELDI